MMPPIIVIKSNARASKTSPPSTPTMRKKWIILMPFDVDADELNMTITPLYVVHYRDLPQTRILQQVD